MKKSLAITFALAAALSVSTVANAGQTSLVSALPTLPEAIALKEPGKAPGLKLVTSDIGRNKETKWHEITANEGFCISDLDSTARWTSTLGFSERTEGQDVDLNHLFEKDGKTLLERTKVHLDPLGSATATARSHVELIEVARGQQGIVIYAYREGTNITILARRAESGMESHTLSTETGMVPFISSDCSFAGVRIDAKKPESGAIAQMSITMPLAKGEKGPAQRFVVDASLSKVTRDPEPKLSVRIRDAKF